MVVYTAAVEVCARKDSHASGLRGCLHHFMASLLVEVTYRATVTDDNSVESPLVA